MLDLQALPYTVAPQKGSLLLAGMLVIWRDQDLEVAIAWTGSRVSLAVGIMLWRQRSLGRLMGNR